MNPCTCSTREKPKRDYPPLPIPTRFKLWCERIARNTRRFKRPHHLSLRECFVTAFALPDNRVLIDEQGRLLHASRSEPLCSIDGQ